MKASRIRKKKERLYRRINFANAELEILRRFCPHKNLERVNYEVRVGLIIEGQIICADCGEVIQDEDYTVPELK